MRAGALAPVAITLWLLVSGFRASATEHSEIAIEAAQLTPPIFHTTTDQRVPFVNRSGRMVHVQFLDDAVRHHVFQVPGSIWAIFHQPGRHPYVVHFLAGGGHDLQGLVEVEDGPARSGDPSTCPKISV